MRARAREDDMNIYDVLQSKRDGNALTDDQIAFFVRGVTDGSVADYQISALLMAIAIRGMDARETLTLTRCMEHSGDVMDLSCFENSCDKHSTGGVGDKTTLIVAPVVAACGLKVAKISGRGLGHTGGTVDKLLSVRGVNVRVSAETFKRIVEETGLCVVEQTKNLVPADKKMYALRDVTATVDSLPLIVSSVMSKKLAAGAKNIVLDVKCGAGAFMKTRRQAAALARSMVDIGVRAGRNVCALVTDMNSPLGHNIGNALEMEEAFEVLKGEKRGDLYEVSLELAARLLRLAEKQPMEICRARCEEALSSGAAHAKLCGMLKALGAAEPIELARAKTKTEICAENDGYVKTIDAYELGRACVELGAGRKQKEDEIDYGAGIVLKKKVGEFVRKGEPLAELYASGKTKIAAARALAESSFTLCAQPVAVSPPVLDVVDC